MEVLIGGVAQLGLTLTDVQVGAFRTYQALLLDWNERMSLTAVRTPEGIQQRHFVDSLSCVLGTGGLNGCSMIDVGTGAGFPGLPLKIIFPQLKLTLVDSVKKKTSFLSAVVEELGLVDVTILAARAETLGQDGTHREQYDWAVARAVAGLGVLAEYLLPLCRVGGHVLAQKGAQVQTELAQTETAVTLLGGGTPELVHVPGTDAYLVSIEKIAPTPSKYPRRVGVPGKRPLVA